MAEVKQTGRVPYLAMMDHCNTPSQGPDSSPAQGLMGQRTRTLLPMMDSLWQCSGGNADGTQKQLRQCQARQAAHYNKGAKDLKLLWTAEQTWVQPSNSHTKQ